MKKRLLMSAVAVCLLSGCVLTGCMVPNYSRLIPENKSAHIKIYNPIYGYIEIDTRVVGDTNTLADLPKHVEPRGP